jgi:hypothetical protein
MFRKTFSQSGVNDYFNQPFRSIMKYQLFDSWTDKDTASISYSQLNSFGSLWCLSGYGTCFQYILESIHYTDTKAPSVLQIRSDSCCWALDPSTYLPRFFTYGIHLPSLYQRFRMVLGVRLRQNATIADELVMYGLMWTGPPSDKHPRIWFGSL